MPIYRIHSSRYTVVDNDILESTSLTWKAKGLLSYMLGRPDSWEFSERSLYNMFPDGQTATRSGIKELEDARYLFRQRVRGEDGKVAGCVWHVFQTPYDQDRIHDLVSQTWQTQTEESTNNKLLNIESTEVESTELFTQTSEEPVFAQEAADGARPVAQSFIDHLNAKTGRRFRVTDSVMRNVRARLSDGYSREDFIAVIDNKSADWLHDQKMSKHLNPETLLRASHFDTYLNQTPRRPNVDLSMYD